MLGGPRDGRALDWAQRVRGVRRLEVVGSEPYLVVQQPRGRFRWSPVLGLQQVNAELVLAQGLRPLPALHIAAHHQPVRILAAPLTRQDTPCQIEASIILTVPVM